MPSDVSVTRYSREDVLRILHLHPSQLRAWERAGLVSTIDNESCYGFRELSQMRRLRDLRGTRISAKGIRASVAAMQRVSGMRDPLGDTSFVRRGARLAFRHAGALVEPESMQLVFDFDIRPSRPMGVESHAISIQRAASHANQIQDMFLRAVALEEEPERTHDAALLYHQILEMQPGHAPASINLGTIHYNRQEFAEAEKLYRNATVADPEYALAFFDLGNVLDEGLRLDEAIGAYSRAIALVPQYADAHYNLALAYERQGQRRRALKHWLMYVRLDPAGAWSAHAKEQARKILRAEKLRIVSRRGCLVATAV